MAILGQLAPHIVLARRDAMFPHSMEKLRDQNPARSLRRKAANEPSFAPDLASGSGLERDGRARRLLGSPHQTEIDVR
jgi:hypothetical protein